MKLCRLFHINNLQFLLLIVLCAARVLKPPTLQHFLL
nr:MAG TPA: hypothetical protein [Caudoviricetes sp.]